MKNDYANFGIYKILSWLISTFLASSIKAHHVSFKPLWEWISEMFLFDSIQVFFIESYYGVKFQEWFNTYIAIIIYIFHKRMCKWMFHYRFSNLTLILPMLAYESSWIYRYSMNTIGIEWILNTNKNIV